MVIFEVFPLLVLVSWIDPSSEDCKVLADCDSGTARWMRLHNDVGAGRPGKRGAEGPPGQKGEPGLGVNITAFKEQLEAANGGPKRHFYTSTLTYDSSKTFCEGFGKSLCSFDQLCIPEKGGRRFVHDVIPGNFWVPVADRHNDWVEIGDNHGAPCFLHNVRWSPPAWGTSATTSAWKGYVYCCNVLENARLPDMRYQYIGQLTTYDSSQQHCEGQGRRLCYSTEICDRGKPRFGIVGEGNHWVAIKDRRNDWIQIASSGTTCRLHNVEYGPPAWGTRDDGSLVSHVGFVFCCAR